jgi:hypothetical protein
MTGEVQPASRWKVVNFLPHTIVRLINSFNKGDVSLSAEDKPPRSATREPHEASSLSLLRDETDEEEDHHSLLEGHAALKFLLAGGIAGAGKDYLCVPENV